MSFLYYTGCFIIGVVTALEGAAIIPNETCQISWTNFALITVLTLIWFQIWNLLKPIQKSIKE